MILNLCLIPDKYFSKELIKVSNNIDSQIGSFYVVGKNSLAHATILQFDSENIEKSKGVLKEIIGTKITVRTKELYSHISSNSGNNWFGVKVELTDELINLQKKAMKLLQIDKENIHNGVGDSFDPHFTTGMKTEKNIVKIEKENITNKEVKCVLRLGISGEHFAVPELV
jgi:2'-5' RNA ligase